MNDPVANSEITSDILQPKDVEELLSIEELSPGDTWASYYGRKADAARRELAEANRVEDTLRELDDATREERLRQRNEAKSRLARDAWEQVQLIAMLREIGVTDEAIATTLGVALDAFLKKHPRMC